MACLISTSLADVPSMCEALNWIDWGKYKNNIRLTRLESLTCAWPGNLNIAGWLRSSSFLWILQMSKDNHVNLPVEHNGSTYNWTRELSTCSKNEMAQGFFLLLVKTSMMTHDTRYQAPQVPLHNTIWGIDHFCISLLMNLLAFSD